MKKVLLLSVAQGEGSGAERTLEYMLAAAPGPWRERVVVASPEGSALQRESVKLGYGWRPWPARRDSLLQNFRACRALRDSGVDASVIHGWGARSLEWVRSLAEASNAVSYGTLHDSPRASFHGRIRRIFIRRAASQLTRFIGVSKAVIDECRELGFADRGLVIYNGLPEIAVAPPVNEGWPLRVGFLGLKLRVKGLEFVAKCASHVRDFPVEWHLYGEPSSETNALLKKFAADEGSRCTCHGFQSPTAIFSSIDVLVHPSLEFEALPTAVVEAARSGLPVIATRVGGTAEIVEEGTSGYLVEPGEPEKAAARLRELFENAARRCDFGKRALEIFRSRFSAARMVEAYARLWEA
ncbi:MAG: glycosyltransferase family 4 protein [Verrucomicrobiae bacterium]|nr:glycosyltransferase family 4 protein [Verrucomicrobiae bacterium]